MKIVEVVSPLQVGETFVQVWSRTVVANWYVGIVGLLEYEKEE